MSRQLEQGWEDRSKRERDRVLAAVYGGVYDSVGYAGGELCGFSVKMSSYDCLMTLRAAFPGGQMVAFVGGVDLPDVLQKAVREGRNDGLRWKPDKWAKT